MPHLELPDLNVHYEEHGEGEPLLLLHGLGSSARDWERQVDALGAHYRLVAPDLRGHGRTDKPSGPYEVGQMALDVARFIEALSLDAVHVVGVSMGGMVSFQLALDHPERVRSLVIVNSLPGLQPRDLRERFQVWQRLTVARLLGMRTLGRMLAGRLFPEEHQQDDRQMFVERWSENDPAAYLAAFRAVLGWSVQERVGEIGCPTLMLTGDLDFFPLELKEECVAAMPDAQLQIIERSRHVTPVDQPEAFNEAVLSFLRGAGADRPGRGG